MFTHSFTIIYILFVLVLLQVPCSSVSRTNLVPPRLEQKKEELGDTLPTKMNIKPRKQAVAAAEPVRQSVNARPLLWLPVGEPASHSLASIQHLHRIVFMKKSINCQVMWLLVRYLQL